MIPRVGARAARSVVVTITVAAVATMPALAGCTRETTVARTSSSQSASAAVAPTALADAAAPSVLADAASRGPGDFRSAALEVAGFVPSDARDDVRRWGGVADGAIALRLERSTIDGTGGHARLRVALLESGGSAVRRRAEGTFDIDRPDCTQTNGESDKPTALLDLAPYKLDVSEMAFGVRIKCGRTFPAGEGSRTTLHLFLEKGPSLTRIFDTVVEDHDTQRGPGDQTEEIATIEVDQKDAGKADLVVRRRRYASKLIEVSPQRPTKRTKVERYVWDGARYVPRPDRH